MNTTTTKCIRCLKPLPAGDAGKEIKGFLHCTECYDETMAPPKPKVEAVRLQAIPSIAPHERLSDPDGPRVQLVKIDVPFGNLVAFYLKASFAAIPVALFWLVVYFVIATIVRGS
jgi:hypothetical protein